MKPLDLRDETAKDYQRNFERMGGSGVPFEAFQKLAESDLGLVDKSEEVSPATPQKKTSLVMPDTEGGAGEKAADAVGGRFERREVRDVGTPIIDPMKALKSLGTEKGRAMLVRLRHILAIIPGSKRETDLASKDYVYPALAKDFLDNFSDYTLWRRKYKDADAVTRRRIFLRTIEDICDRSNGAVGVNWWVR